MSTPSRRDQLLALAGTILERDGVEGLGVGSLAREAGIKPPSLYKQFGGIEEIRAALVAEGFADFDSALAALTDASRQSTAPPGVAPPAPEARPPDPAAVRETVRAFARTYREQALAMPQRYRLMTARPLARDLLPAGSERAAMQPLLDLFGETVEHHDVSRAAWAWAHGLVSLEIAERFPPGADLDAGWELLVDGVTSLLARRTAATRP